MGESVTIVYEEGSINVNTDTPIITVSDDTPIVTITDDQSSITITDPGSSITVIEDNPTVTISSNQPSKVIVNTGLGGSYDSDAVISLLAGQISEDELNFALTTSIANTADMWSRIGNEIVLLYQDGVDIEQSAIATSQDSIDLVVVDLEVTDGKADLALSNISIEAARIDLNVTHLTDHDDDITVANSRITLTESDIALHTTRLDTNDDDVLFLQSGIDINANQIAINVTAHETNATDIITTQTGLQATDDTLTLYSVRLDTAEGDISAAQIELTATSATTTIQQTSIDGLEHDLIAVETMSVNKWGVTITEDPGGLEYATGIGLVLHPDWSSGSVSYSIDDYVYFFDSGVGHVYKALTNHVSSTSNYPTAATGDWVEEDTGKKSSFRVDAEEFVVYDVTNDLDNPLFRIDGTAVVLGDDIALRSINYGHSTEPWFNFDPADGTAELRNITMTFSGSGNLEDAQAALLMTDAAGLTGKTVIANGVVNTDLVVADSIDVTNLEAVSTSTGELIVGIDGAMYSTGKTSFADTTAGFFLGYDVTETAYVFNIGDATHFLKWSGTELIFTGTLSGAIAGSYLDYEVPRTNIFTTNSSYTKVLEMIIGRGGTFTVKFDMKSGNVLDTASGRLYKNGSPVGTERTTTSTSYTTYSENITLVTGDLLQIYGKTTSIGVPFTATFDVFGIYSGNPINSVEIFPVS